MALVAVPTSGNGGVGSSSASPSGWMSGIGATGNGVSYPIEPTQSNNQPAGWMSYVANPSTSNTNTAPQPLLGGVGATTHPSTIPSEAYSNHTATVAPDTATGSYKWNMADQNGNITSGNDYNAIVNQHNGQWLNHKWVSGSYVNGVWTPTSSSTPTATTTTTPTTTSTATKTPTTPTTTTSTSDFGVNHISDGGGVVAPTSTNTSTNTSTSGPTSLQQLYSMIGYDPSAIASEAQAQYQAQLAALTGQQTASDKLLQDQLNGSQSALDNKAFQNWLTSRDSLGGRGLGNSGFINDAMVRNQLSEQQQMQQLYATAMDNINKNDTLYGDKIAALDPATIQATLQKNALSGVTPFLPYLLETANNSANNALKQYEFGNLSANQLATLSGQLPNGGGPTLAAIDQMNKQLNQAGYANVNGSYTPTLTAQNDLGYINGQPTTTEQKILSQNQQWAATNQLTQEKINQSGQALAEKTSYDQQLISQGQAKINNSAVNSQINGLKTSLDSLGTQIDNMRSNGATAAQMQPWVDQYNTLLNTISSTMASAGVSLGN